MKELYYLNKYFFKYKYHFLAGIFITVVAQFFTLYTPKLIGESIKAVEEAQFEVLKTKSLLFKNILLIIGTTLVAGFLTFLMRQTLIVMSRHIEFDLKNEIYAHYQLLSQKFYKNNRTGDLMSRISEDVGKVRQYVGPAVMYSINTIIRFAVVLVQMYLVSPQLTLYSLLPLPLLAYSIFKVSAAINQKSTAYQQSVSKLSSFTQEFFSGIRVIKAYSLEKNKEAAFAELTKESQQKNNQLAFSQALFGPLMILLIGASNLVVVCVGGIMYSNGSVSDIGVIAQFILYINMLTWPVASLGWVSSMVQEADASQKRINEFLKTPEDIINQPITNSIIKGGITFKNVGFTYDDTAIKALNNISFELKSGQTLAILGKTGSGKSTLLSLLSRLYDTTQGSIMIDGNNIKDYDLSALRAAIAVVPQDPFLFSDTIENNIKFGNENANNDEIINVARQAHIHHSISEFTNGYQTILGERGITLSGGQKQRVSIARALLKEAPILLLDDCLSAVDTETEEIILKNLEPICAQKTTIIVSHRVSSAKNADYILVLEDGGLIEQGTHNQLLQQNGWYHDLYHKQLSEKDLN